ncbi:MAG: TonB-dependent receptor [Halieaceae bacterium]|nr:TonB-dependent receptor [Halieaceae bacterium]
MRHPRPTLLPAAMAAALLSCGSATHAQESADSLFDLSLEELLNVEVTGASRKSQKLSETAAAAFVITAKDIRRSGALTIPEALRMVPGLHVGQIDGNNYAVSARGSNDRFARKMLVMIDGRTLYTPAYSGVYWDLHEIPMDDIERIEVVRGPGSALWGINAVNGVINVVTRHADDSQGGMAMASAGNKVNHDAVLRWGGSPNDETAYRVYLQSKDRDGNRTFKGDSSADTAEQKRVGGRLDWHPTESDTVTLSADLYDIDSGASFNVLRFEPPYQRTREDDVTHSEGFSLLGRWNRQHGELGETTAHAYVDVMDREDPLFGEDKDTVEFELQHRSLALDGHDIIAGATVRYHDIELTGSEAQFLDGSYYDNLIVSLFAQDEFDLLEDKLTLTLGAKLERNDTSDSDWEFMPSARLLWAIDSNSSAWFAVTNAVRSPAIAEQYARVSVALDERHPNYVPGLSLPLFASLKGTGRMRSEDLLAFEAGYRSQLTSNLNIDIAVYYNDYQNTRWPKFDDIACGPVPGPFPACLADPQTGYLEFQTELANAADSEGMGAEIAVNWQALEWWQLMAAYTYQDYDITPDAQPAEGSQWDADHLFSLQSRMDLGERAEFDLWLRYVDEVEYYFLDSYWELNLRVSWELTPELEISLIGNNLLDSAHGEYSSVQDDTVPTEIERAYRAEIRYRF